MRTWLGGLAGCAAAALLSAVLLAPAPAYDPTAWLLWGRELAGLGLDTRDGPAFKPLPVLVCVALAPAGEWAPEAWVIVARTAALAGVGLAALVAVRLGGAVGGVAAAVAVIVTPGYVALAAAGTSEGLLLALGLGAILAWRSERPRLALGLLAACALVRVEAWPFAAVAAVVHARRTPGDRTALMAAALVVPACWFVPEWLGSGEPLRSGVRARIPNPGQPALAEVPALASLAGASALVPLLVVVGTAGLALGRDRRPAAGLALLGLAWTTLVAAMSQAGFSGEARYALPGVAILGVAAGVGAARLVAWRPRVALPVIVLAAVAGMVPWAVSLPDLARRLDHQARLIADLDRAVTLAGGRAAVLRCGRPAVGPLRGPLMAYALRVPKRVVRFETAPPGVVFVSRLTPRAPALPVTAATRGGDLVRAGTWRVRSSCPTPPRNIRLP